MAADTIEAITVDEIKEELWDSFGLNPPDNLQDHTLRRKIRRKTAVVLAVRGLTSLPATGALEREIINDAVSALVSLDVRKMHPAWAEQTEGLEREERNLIERLKIVEDSSDTATRFDVVGGAEE